MALVDIDIGRKEGFNRIAVHHVVLPPGCRTSDPHAHTHEEEFAYVLSGQPTLWLNGQTTILEKGQYAAFPANTGDTHVLINDTTEDVVYLCIGETQDFADEKISYPLNPLRQKQCVRKGWYWLDAPLKKMGPHNSRASKKLNEHIKFKLVDEHTQHEVLDIFKKAEEYFFAIEGCAPTLKIVEKDIAGTPKNKPEKYFKEFLIIEMDGKNIGVLDLHANYPEEGVCYLGLLLITKENTGRGLGKKIYALAEDYIKRALECNKIVIGISDANDVSGFWQKMGYQLNGKSYEWQGENTKTTVFEYDKRLT